MRDYLNDLKDNWRDEYWRADHPEFQMGIALLGFLLMGLMRIGFNLIDLLLARRLAV